MSSPRRQVRPLHPGDANASRLLGWEAFGVPPDADPDAAPPPARPGMHLWGLVEGDALVARAVDREYHSWYGGAEVPTAGIAGVTVQAERRGTGLLGPLLDAVIDGARARGAAISALFPTAPGIYRRTGFETIAQFDSADVPTAALADVRVPEFDFPRGSLHVRRAGSGDAAAVAAVYDAWAAAQNGPLTRRGPSYPVHGDDPTSGTDVVSLAVDDDDRVHGFARWDRGPGYGEAARITVADLVATRADATAVLLRMLGSFASVAATTRLDSSGPDLARHLLPSSHWRVVTSRPYMLRVLDPAAAFGLRRYPRHVDADLVLAVADERFGDLHGSWRLEVSDGTATCSRTDAAATLTFSARGLAVGYAGAQGTANLRMAGLLTGPPGDDEVWDSLFGGRQVHVRDYF